MVNYREILRLHSLGQSQRTIRSSAHCSDNTVRTVLEVASQKGIQWPLDDDITNADLERMLFPDKYKSACLYIEPDYPYIHREPAKSGVTLTLLREEYRSKCYETGKTPCMSTQFGDKYRKWARVTKATMRIQHKPGDAIQVDWAGDTIHSVQNHIHGINAVFIFLSYNSYNFSHSMHIHPTSPVYSGYFRSLPLQYSVS